MRTLRQTVSLQTALSVGLLAVFAAPLCTAADPNAPTAMVEIRIVQFDPNANVAAPDPAVLAKAIPVPNVAAERRSARDPNVWESVGTVPRGRDLLLNGHLLPAQQPCASQPADAGAGTAKTAVAASSPWREIAAPRLIAFVGQKATVQIGNKVPYMVQRPDGSLVMAELEFEGLALECMLGEATARSVALEQLEVKLAQAVGRSPIPDVPFEVGKPIMRIQHLNVSLRIAPDQLAVIPLPGSDQMYILVGAALAAGPSDAGSPARSVAPLTPQ